MKFSQKSILLVLSLCIFCIAVPAPSFAGEEKKEEKKEGKKEEKKEGGEKKEEKKSY